jgi:hypothetical protein
MELLEVVVKAKETLAADHPSRLALQHALALAYDADGLTHKAIDLLESVVDIKTRILLADRPPLVMSVEALVDMRAEPAFESDEASSCASVESPTMAASVELDVM